MKPCPNVLALSGGVGGAKLVLGLSHELPSEALTIIANTADDFEHLGLSISPDLDTVMYTLAVLVNPEFGWGVAGDTRACLQAIERLAGESWFILGDQDIATHLLRSQWLREGRTITEVTGELCRRLGVKPRLFPMCDEPVRTLVHCRSGGHGRDGINEKEVTLPFQEYFVRHRCVPAVSGFEFSGIANSTVTADVQAAIQAADILVVCPSNPFVSVAPILAVNGMRAGLHARNIPRVVVSPIVGGIAIKGPAAKMMQELAMPATALAIAEYYRDFATHFVLDSADQQYHQAISDMGITVIVTNTIMKTLEDRRQLAAAILSQVTSG